MKSNDLKTEEKIYTVSEYLDFINSLIAPQKVVVQGEISQISPGNGYVFFSILDKNEKAVLKCFIWQRILNNLGIELKEGLEIQVKGFSRIYKPNGRFTFEIENLGLIGEGALKLAFEKLRKQLLTEGYFEAERKKPIPPYPQKIGLITSGFGDAKNDFLTHIGVFGYKINFISVRVEGLMAVDEITKAIRFLNENLPEVEVLVITRGGGSLESLQAFNSESMVKTIIGSRIPIVTGIGHENDETLADLAADYSASTPTDAARIISEHWRNAELTITNAQKNITSLFMNSHSNYKKIVATNEAYFLALPRKIISIKEIKLNDLQRLLESQIRTLISQIKQIQTKFFTNWGVIQNLLSNIKNEISRQEAFLNRESFRWSKFIATFLSELEQKLALGNPEARLKQGYSIVANESGKIIKSAKQLSIGQTLNLKLYQGTAKSKVNKINN